HVAEDAYLGDAQFSVAVDGKNVGTFTAHASHTAGQWEDVTLTGNFGASGPGKVDVTFLNDATSGAWPNDRNLYVDYVDVNGHVVQAETQVGATASGSAAALYSNGTLSLNTTGSAPAAAPAPAPAPTPVVTQPTTTTT